MKAATKRGIARSSRGLERALPREVEPAVREAASAVIEAVANFLLAIAKTSAPREPPLVVSPFDARQTRRLVEAGKLAAIKVGRAWYGRPSDFEALLSTAATARMPTNDHDLKRGAEQILQEELARRGLRLRKAAAPQPNPRLPRELAASPAGSHSPRALPPARGPR